MKLRPFELALVVIFGIMMVLSIVLLKIYKPAPKEGVAELGGAVTIWGTLDPLVIRDMINKIADEQDAYRRVQYRQVEIQDFDERFINALADGVGPDLLLLPHELLVAYRNRIQATPYTSLPERDYRNMYVDGASIFTLSDGIYGFPIMVDPLMMYWNRDIFSFSNRITAPTTWEEIVADVVPEITVRDQRRTINQATLAMGGYTNIRNAFPVISLLLLQGGSALVTEDRGRYTLRLNETLGAGGRPFTTAMTFYTNFTATDNTLYTWNDNLPLDQEAFLREELALYFGFGSEARELEAKNPNLNFDIASVPQGATATTKRTYGTFYAFMVPKAAKNKTGAYGVIQLLSSVANAKALADGYQMAPVHRATVAAGSNDIYGRVIYSSVPQVRGWLNPDLSETEVILRTLVEQVNANRGTANAVVDDAMSKLQRAY
jgi:ABC-type glycerol-3-phosphate transport system substrate-binding protein